MTLQNLPKLVLCYCMPSAECRTPHSPVHIHACAGIFPVVPGTHFALDASVPAQRERLNLNARQCCLTMMHCCATLKHIVFLQKGMCKTVKSADRALVDKLKAYYVLQKDGKQSPGKKGISLPADQFHLLRNVSSNLTEALESRNKSFEVQLSGK